MAHLLEIRIEDLLLEHREVSKKRVRRCIAKINNGKPFKPVSVTYCAHDGKYHLDKGHHRAAALFFLRRSSVLAYAEPCYHYECAGYMPHCEPFYNIRHIIME